MVGQSKERPGKKIISGVQGGFRCLYYFLVRTIGVGYVGNDAAIVGIQHSSRESIHKSALIYLAGALGGHTTKNSIAGWYGEDVAEHVLVVVILDNRRYIQLCKFLGIYYFIFNQGDRKQLVLSYRTGISNMHLDNRLLL